MPIPEYDPDSKENPFSWVLDAAKRVRAERQSSDESIRRTRKIDTENMRLFDAFVDAEDGTRLKALRDRYNQNRRQATK